MMERNPDGTLCVKRYDDIVWLRDDKADGHSFVYRMYRTDNKGDARTCRNPHGRGTWARCNFDWDEDHYWAYSANEYEASTRQWTGNWVPVGYFVD